jgi:hypothetical protein
MQPVFKLAPRSVRVADYLVNGHVLYYSVRSDGEQGALRSVPPGVDPTDAIAWLWADLDRIDPLPATSHDASLTSPLPQAQFQGHGAPSSH